MLAFIVNTRDKEKNRGIFFLLRDWAAWKEENLSQLHSDFNLTGLNQAFLKQSDSRF